MSDEHKINPTTGNLDAVRSDDDLILTYVPYTGATANVDLGAYGITTTGNYIIRSDTGYIDLGATADDYKIQWDGSDAVHTISAGDFHFIGGDLQLPADSQKIYFGEDDDASITYDGTNLIINPQEVGSGYVQIPEGANLQIGASDGSALPSYSYIRIGDSGYAAFYEKYDDAFAISAGGSPAHETAVGSGNADVFIAGWDSDYLSKIFYFGDIDSQSHGNYFSILTDGHSFNGGNVYLPADSQKLYFGEGDDAYAEFDGNSLNIVANNTTAGDDMNFSADEYNFNTTGEKVHINSDGDLIIGDDITEAESVMNVYAQFALIRSGHAGMYGIAATDSGFPFFSARRARGSLSSLSAVQDGDILMRFGGSGYHGSDWTTNNRSVIEFKADGAFTSNTDTPTRIEFQTTPDGSGTVWERMRIDNNGDIHIGKGVADSKKMIWGAGDDVSIYFDGSDMIINSENVTASDEIHFQNFDALKIASGDLYFTGDGSGVPYGEFHGENINETVTVSVANTAYEIDIDNLTGGLTNLTTFVDSGGTYNHALDVTKAGVYKITWDMSLETATAGDEIEGGIMVNGTAVVTKGTSHTYVAANSVSSTISASALLDLSAGDDVTLYIRNHTAARDIVIEHVSCVINMVGGT